MFVDLLFVKLYYCNILDKIRNGNKTLEAFKRQ